MKELSLFSGAGGGVLGTQLLGWEAIGYVEYNEYCQQVIAQRIEDGCLDNAPIFSDVNAFISEGYADAYKGMVGVISAGFPCQPFSVAGKKAAKDDPRNCWPQTLDIIRRVRPRYCLLENVGGLLSRKHRYFETILKDLAESGYDAWWKIISAAEVGAPHKRDRLWVVAHASSERLEGRELPIGEEEEYATTGSTCWWDTEPRVGRVAHGMAHRVDRLKALGNGQVPAVAATAFKVFEPDVGEMEWRRQRALTNL
tara:strand:- start:47 stop:811 length:765 start_codon:yes stop_codon:yes gene_type:complete